MNQNNRKDVKFVRKSKRVLASLICFLLCISVLSVTALAEPVYSFPLKAPDGTLVADANTKFITSFKQDPATKIITATVQVQHGSADATQQIILGAISVDVLYSDKVAPCYVPANIIVPPGYKLNSYAEIYLYSKPLISNFSTYGSPYITREMSGGGLFGTKIGCIHPDDALKINPGETRDILEFYFRPVNGVDELDLSMFSYTHIFDASVFANDTSWIAYGTTYMYSKPVGSLYLYRYIDSPGSFKMHMQKLPPAVSANNSNRTIDGYNASAMEWSYNKDGPYYGGAPTVGADEQTIYVRAKADDYYSGYDPTFGAHKKYTASDPTPVNFEAATSGYFELRALDGALVADSNTEYITLLKQNPVTKVISATIQIKNGNPNEQLVIAGACAAISYSDKVAPYNMVYGDLFAAGRTSYWNSAEFALYSKSLFAGFNLFGTQYINRDINGGGIMGTMLSCMHPDFYLKIPAGQTANVMEFYFKPVNGYDTLSEGMFNNIHVFDPDTLMNLSPWLANGSRYLHMVAYRVSSIMTYVESPNNFKCVIEP